MNLLNLKKLAAALTAVCSLAFASTASAALILTNTSASYLGYVDKGTPADPDSEEDYVDQLVGMAINTGPVTVDSNKFTRSGNAFVGMPAASFISKHNNPDKEDPDFELNFKDTFVLDGSVDYALAKYGFGDWVWFLDGYIGTIEIDHSFGKGSGLSHISFFGTPTTRVPDSASTLLLIGLGLASVGFVARRRKA